jgi:hypothetical protein
MNVDVDTSRNGDSVPRLTRARDSIQTFNVVQLLTCPDELLSFGMLPSDMCG